MVDDQDREMAAEQDWDTLIWMMANPSPLSKVAKEEMLSRLNGDQAALEAALEERQTVSAPIGTLEDWVPWVARLLMNQPAINLEMVNTLLYRIWEDPWLGEGGRIDLAYLIHRYLPAVGIEIKEVGLRNDVESWIADLEAD